MALKDKQDENRRLDMQKNILAAAQISASTNEEVSKLYASRVKPLVVSSAGSIVTDADFDSVVAGEKPGLLPLYKILSENKETSSYVYPVVGTGLWSKLLGYLAVTPNGRDIVGITFYKQGETPGLGAEIVQPWFRDDFIGKSLYKGDKLVGVTVVKGKAKDSSRYKTDSNHLVDGISGATITGDGVTKMLDEDPMKYAPFFSKHGNDK